MHCREIGRFKEDGDPLTIKFKATMKLASVLREHLFDGDLMGSFIKVERNASVPKPRLELPAETGDTWTTTE